YLRAYRFQTVDAGDGQTALELLKEHQDIQLVISDYNMPGMDGFTLLEKIRQTHSRAQLPFIGVSGANAPYLSARFIKLGANDFLAKPFSKEELYCRVLNSIEMLEYIAELHKLDETKNRFLGMAAHDLRNPINSISGFSGLLLETLEDKIDPQSLQFLKHINQSSDEMLSIVNDLLDINTIQAGRLEIKRERHNIAAILQDRVSLFDTMASRKQIELVFSSEFDDDVLVDRVRICQVLDNLISNAIKFTPSGGTVNVMLADNKQEVRIGVRDSGPGISSDDQKRLFVPYSRAAARPTGGEQSTGLGLAITKRIVEAHGGQVGIDSSLGKGAEFWVLLPKN
ncbi:MAG: hybrid sensor histidine kinase/response regulator, partial [Spirochaetaceae bacterium]